MFSLCVATDKPAANRLCSLIAALLILLQITKSTTAESCGIKNGTSWPWNVQLIDTNERNVLCEGTLVSDQLILTAAHCLHDSDGDPIELYRFSIVFNDGTVFSVTRSHYPKPYDPLRLDHDVALVALNRKKDFNRLVGPVCVATSAGDSKLKAFEDIHCPAFGERTLEGRSEEACRTTTRDLFQMTYDGVVCMGRFQKTHRYHPYAGSGLVLKSFGSWNLIGVLMYTTGVQSNKSDPEVDFAGGVRIERYIPWIDRIIRHYTILDLSDEKCQQYNREGSPSSNVLYTANLRSSQNRCYGVLISPRFVLSTTECANQTTRVMVLNGPNFRDSKTQLVDIVRIHHEEWDGKIALIELMGNVSSSFSPPTCLWNGQSVLNLTSSISARNESLVQQIVSHVQFHPDSPLLQVRYRCLSREQPMMFTTFGDLIGVQVAGEPRPRIVGLLDGVLECDYFDHYYNRQRTAEAINVQQYLPWIEDVVWRNGVGSKG